MIEEATAAAGGRNILVVTRVPSREWLKLGVV
jgi:hypothetical protein